MAAKASRRKVAGKPRPKRSGSPKGSTIPKRSSIRDASTTTAAPAPTRAEIAARRAAERTLLEITSLPTAAGREHRVIAWIERWVAERAERVVLARDRFGNLTVAAHGFLEACAKGARPILITAHLDHPAFVVSAVRPGKKPARKPAHVDLNLDLDLDLDLDLEFRGGVNDPYFKGAALEVFDRKTNRSYDARITSLDAKIDPATKPFKTVVARLATPAGRAAAARGLIAPGSIARWKFPKAEIRGGIVHTHACDDLAALAAALVAFDGISRDPALAHVALLFTRSEEIGFIGAIGAARAGTVPKSARLVCLENSRSFPHDSPIGAGPIVRVGDRLSVFSPELTNRIGDVAAAHAKDRPAFRYQRKLMPGGACEATAFASFGIASTCVCLPLGNYHNMQDIDGVAAGTARARVGREFISADDFHGLVELLGAIARRLDDPSVAAGTRALMDTLWSRHAKIVGGA